MLPFQIGRHRGAEREDHCRRVALLASRTSAFLRLSGVAQEGLTAAAALHHTWSVFHAATVGLESRPPETATAILDRLYQSAPTPHDDLGLAARVLEICDAFDEAMEFAALERISLTAAADSFLRETASEFDGRVVDAFRRATAGVEHKPSSSLPVMPKRAAALLRTSDETTSAAELTRIAAGDPVLSGKLIAVANSGRYGSRNTITGLNEATLRVGVPVARKVLLAACLGGLFASKPLQTLWQHSQDVAAMSFEISKHCDIDGNTAWLAGLLHDIGRLVLISCPAASEINLAELLQGGFPLVYAETLTFGTNHAAAGSSLLKDWGIPREIVAAVEAHHEPERSERPLPAIVFLAEQLTAKSAVPAEAMECLSTDFRLMIACRNTGLTPAVLEKIERAPDVLARAG